MKIKTIYGEIILTNGTLGRITVGFEGEYFTLDTIPFVKFPISQWKGITYGWDLQPESSLDGSEESCLVLTDTDGFEIVCKTRPNAQYYLNSINKDS